MEVLIILATLLGLALGGQQFVAAAAAIGRRLGMSAVLIGATIIAIGTSLPEWAISVGAALSDSPGLSVGNVVGSNVCNMAIVLGLAALVTPVLVARRAVLRDAVAMLVATGLLIAVASDGEITRLEGGILLGLAVVTIVVSVATGRTESEETSTFRWWDIPRAILGLGLVLVSSYFFVDAARTLALGAADRLAIEKEAAEWLLGVTLAAIGTSLPELVTSIAAAVQKRPGIIVGNVLGSSSMNIFFVLGSAASLKSMAVPHFALWDVAVFAAVMILPCVCLFSHLKVTRFEGALLLGIGLWWYVQQAL